MFVFLFFGILKANLRLLTGLLRRYRRLNLLVSQPFLFICVGQYIIVKVEITTLE
jgi:hypothetical protein